MYNCQRGYPQATSSYFNLKWVQDQLCNIGPCTSIALFPLCTMEIVENLELQLIIAKIDFLLIFQQKENVLENLTFG